MMMIGVLLQPQTMTRSQQRLTVRESIRRIKRTRMKYTSPTKAASLYIGARTYGGRASPGIVTPPHDDDGIIKSSPSIEKAVSSIKTESTCDTTIDEEDKNNGIVAN
jgi:hypothetical protein